MRVTIIVDEDVFIGDDETENLEHDIAELEDCLATCDVTELSANERETFAVEAQKLGKRVSKYIQVREKTIKSKRTIEVRARVFKYQC